MINERPVLYAGGDADSHAFVVDGYSLNDYFHVNWGWGGNCDGYYLLSYLHPKSMYFDFQLMQRPLLVLFQVIMLNLMVM